MGLIISLVLIAVVVVSLVVVSALSLLIYKALTKNKPQLSALKRGLLFLLSLLLAAGIWLGVLGLLRYLEDTRVLAL
jgi:Mg2+/citrate symporter